MMRRTRPQRSWEAAAKMWAPMLLAAILIALMPFWVTADDTGANASTPANESSNTPAGEPSNVSTPAGEPSNVSTPAGEPSNVSTPADESSNASAPAGESSEAASALQFPNHPGLIIVPVAVSQYTDLRVQTDRVRERPSGETEQVYELQHPRKGAVFLEFELHVSNDGDPWSVRPPEVRLQPLDPDAKPVPVRDFATESERIPLDMESVLIVGKKILYLRFEPDLEGIDDLTLWIEDAELGTVAQLRELAGPTPVETEAGTIEYPDRK